MRALHMFDLVHAALAVDVLPGRLKDEARAHAHLKVWNGLHLIRRLRHGRQLKLRIVSRVDCGTEAIV